MAGRVCRVFKGHTLFDCFNMTPKQLYGMYLESLRQEAREKMMLLSVQNIPKLTGDAAQEAYDMLKFTAYPPDEEEDVEFSNEVVRNLKRALMGR